MHDELDVAGVSDVAADEIHVGDEYAAAGPTEQQQQLRTSITTDGAAKARTDAAGSLRLYSTTSAHYFLSIISDKCRLNERRRDSSTAFR